MKPNPGTDHLLSSAARDLPLRATCFHPIPQPPTSQSPFPPRAPGAPRLARRRGRRPGWGADGFPDPAPPMSSHPVVTADDVRAAAGRLAGVAHRTPVVRSRTLDALAGADAFLKCENLQRVGAFKFRGAYNAVSRLDPAHLERGVAAYSSGNHAQPVALSARILGTSAVILMPEDAPPSKVAAVRGYGAEVVTYDRYTGDRAALGRELAEGRGLALIPPYEHPHVIAGQGTAALELLEDAGTLDEILVPVGGGGLAAGTALIATELQRGIRVVGVEPDEGDDT